MVLLIVYYLVAVHCISHLLGSEPTPNLSYLGPSIFGKPRTVDQLIEWNPTSSYNPEELGEYAEGDILFPQPTRNGLVAEVARWKNGIIPYEIANSFTNKDRQMIEAAMTIYRKYTCIKFRPRSTTDVDYLAIVNGNSGCWSSVGRITGRQEVNLQSPYCTTKVGTAMHEMMHALGFLHEQNRWERDDFVSIAWQNIKSGHENNFKKADKDTTDGYGVSYDFRSVMHYSPMAFSMNGQPTIVPKDSRKNEKMGQRDGFSRGDIRKINAMYGCSNKIPGQPNDKDHKENTIDKNNNNNNNNNNIGGGILSFLFNLIDT